MRLEAASAEAALWVDGVPVAVEALGDDAWAAEVEIRRGPWSTEVDLVDGTLRDETAWTFCVP